MWFFLVLLSTFGWAAVAVLDSSLVKRYHKHPLALMWPQSWFTLVTLFIVACTADIAVSSWVVVLLVSGGFAYIGDILFFRILDKVDASVSNIAWAILTVMLSIAGLLLFHESLSVLQLLGAALVLAGTLCLSLWHREVAMGRAIAMLAGLALLYVPYYIAKKAALDDGNSILTVFFWLLLGREMLSFSVPLIIPSFRKIVLSNLRRVDGNFFFVCGLVILFFFGAEYFGTLAYKHGSISLASIVSNVQPFLVILLAWIASRLLPRFEARELLSLQSVTVKLVSFSIVFCGLALLAVSQ